MRKSSGFGMTKTIVHKMDDIEVFPVTKDQLTQLEKGTNADLFLEVGLSLISICGSFLCSFLVIDFTTAPKTYNTFLIICLTSGIASIIMLFLWGRNRKDKNELIKKIKSQEIDV